MTDISNKTLGVIVGIALVVSLIGLFSLNNSPITGLGHTGLAKINITQLAEFNVTQTTIDFGNGSIEQGAPGGICQLTTSEATGDPRNCWLADTDGATNGFLIENVGNVKLNISVVSEKANADDFWGASGGQYRFKCSGNGTVLLSDYTTVGTSADDCIGYLNATNGEDVIRMDINITIPASATGIHNDTVTFAGTASS